MLKSLLARSFISIALGGLVSLPAAAHFQEILPSDDVLVDGGDVDIDLVFTHPFENGPVMNMQKPASVGVLFQGEKHDLMDKLVETKHDDASAWKLSYELAEPGAAIFYVTPKPYWEPAEGIYIVHHAKVIVDSFASGDGWDEMVGLPAEIQPLTRPTGLWAGNSFTGVVTKNGKPVPFAEIEVEYVNDSGITAPNDAFITQMVKTDANGTFTYAMPFPGWWGFAALLDGDEPMKSPDGQDVPVEEGALIWVHASPVEN